MALRRPAARRLPRAPKDMATAALQLSPEQAVAAAPSAPSVIKMRVVNGNPAAPGHAQELLASRSHYFIGNEPARWSTNVPQYARVQYDEVYHGIDLAYYGNQTALEYDFIVKPGADPRQIRIAFEGVTRTTIDAAGELVLQTEAGEIRHQKPLLYQETPEGRQVVPGHYVALGEHEVGFAVESYDPAKTLVIDPVLIYSTYLGGLDNEYGNGIEADAAGNAYVSGITYSVDFPTKAPLQFSLAGVGNAFVAKYDASGRLVYSTFLGGAGEDGGFAVATDGQGSAYVAGTTDSSNFPTTNGAAQPSRNGRLDGFIAKLSPQGDSLVFSTFLGGQADDTANSLAVDATGNVYVTGQTRSTNFPTRSAWQGSIRGAADAFLTKLNAAGSGFVYSTYLGGNGLEAGFGVAVDGSNNALLTGLVYSSDFPTRNALQTTLGGAVDAFATKFNASGSALVYSTYLGGSFDEGGYGIGVDSGGNAYVSGFSASLNFPTKNAVQAQNRGGDDAFVLKLDPAGALLFSTYLGGSGEDRAFDLATDASGNTYVGGRTDSANFPILDAVQPTLGTGQNAQMRTEPDARLTPRGAVERAASREAFQLTPESASAARPQAVQQTGPLDGFVVKYDPNGNILYATYLGGTDEEKIFAIALDNRGNAYVTGLTASSSFPLKNPAQPTLRGVVDVFVAKLADLGDTQKTVSAASYLGVTLAPDQIVSSFGSGLTTETVAVTQLPLPTSLLDCEVRVEDSRGVSRLASLFFISPTQINFTLPTGTAEGAARITVWNHNAIVSSEAVQVAAVAPGLFSANSTGKDVLAGVLLRVKSDGRQLYEPVARFETGLNKFVPVPIEFGNDQLFLLAFGTGLRYRGGLPTINANIGGVPSEVLFAGAQGSLVGLDQINLALSPTLAGRGNVNLAMAVDGKSANTITLSFR